MGRSDPGGENERELARMETKVIAAERREGRQANVPRRLRARGNFYP